MCARDPVGLQKKVVMRFVLLVVALLLLGCELLPPPTDGSQTQPFPKKNGDSQTVRFASWNVRNFFDWIDDPYSDEVFEKEAFRKKLVNLATVIDEIDPEFIGLQEVENLACLKLLNSALARPFPQLGLIEGNDKQRGIDVCFLSRLPVKKVVSHVDHRLPQHPDAPPYYFFSRDCLEVRLDSTPPTVILINHLKSGRGDAKVSAAKRRVQSLGIVEVSELADKRQGDVLMVMGDLNDRPDSWSLEPVFEKFHDAFKDVPKKERVTHRYRKGASALDHILVDDDGRSLLGENHIWKELARRTSDHNPVAVEMRLELPSTPPSEKTWSQADAP